MNHETLLIIDSSEGNADLFYVTGFFVPDPVIYIEHSGEKILVLNDLEIDRGEEEAEVDTVLSLSEYKEKLPSEKREKAKLVEITELIFNERGIKRALVPGRFPVKYADELRERGFEIVSKKEEPFFEGRLKKTPQEVEFIEESLRNTEEAMSIAIEMVSLAEIKEEKLHLYGEVLTSEIVKGEINAELSRRGFTASHTIVACGTHSSMPHNTGSGPIYAGKPVIIDIFPRSQKSGYFGDMTRTVVKGEPSRELEKMYQTVLEAQQLAMSLIEDGVSGKEVHKAITGFFEENGFETGEIDGRRQGFIHSTGHGLGLEIHEPPRVGPGDTVLNEGNVVTVEPGLYYEKLGGIRIEDVVLVEKEGCRNLTSYEKIFKI